MNGGKKGVGVVFSVDVVLLDSLLACSLTHLDRRPHGRLFYARDDDCDCGCLEGAKIAEHDPTDHDEVRLYQEDAA